VWLDSASPSRAFAFFPNALRHVASPFEPFWVCLLFRRLSLLSVTNVVAVLSLHIRSFRPRHGSTAEILISMGLLFSFLYRPLTLELPPRGVSGARPSVVFGVPLRSCSTEEFFLSANLHPPPLPHSHCITPHPPPPKPPR